MGCPDWPKCFGQWVPPTSVAELPADYKEKYASYRDAKNQKFARYLTALGFAETAEKIKTDPSILVEADFNATKTWVEYLNRLVGVAIGLFIVAVAFRSIRFRHQRPAIFWMAMACLAGVLVQGWFGSIVVSTNLTTWTVTVHMFLALVIVAILLHLYHASDDREHDANTYPRALRPLLVVCMLLLLVQVFLGTQVREAIDIVAQRLPREGWIAALGIDFIVHRSFSWVVLLSHLALLLKWRKTTGLNPLTLALIILILATVLTGVGMAYSAVPAFLQPLHLLIATIAFGIQYLLLLRINRKAPLVLETSV